MQHKSPDICQEEVYKSLFLEYAEGLRNFVYSKCGDAGLAADIVQESFVKLWLKCASVLFEKAKPFLFTVAKRLFLDNIKHQKVVLNHKMTIVGYESPDTPQDLMEGQEFKKKLETAINAMPEKSREVFMMSKVEGLKYREIAERLELSVKAIEKRMGIALRIFSDKMR